MLAPRSLIAFPLLLSAAAAAAPPVVVGCGERLAISDRITVVEGGQLDVTVQAADPDGDPLTWSAENLPDWLALDPSTGRLTGQAPLWSDDTGERNRQTGAFDITVSVTDGVWTVDRPVTVEVQDASWHDMSLTELMAARPVTEPEVFREPVALRNVQEERITSAYGGGVELRKICFGFTSQVPLAEGREHDWDTELSCAYLPVGEPAVQNGGAIVEGAYSREFGEEHLAEEAAAVLGVPVLIIDRDWDWDHPSNLMEPYNQTAAADRDPAEIFYVFSVAHYLRAADALATVIDTMTPWEVDFDSFQAVYTGFSKMGHTAFLTGAADPGRTAGFMAAGAAGFDGAAGRLLGTLQGAEAFNPEQHPGYLGTMMRSFVIDRIGQAQADPHTFALEVLGTDEHRDDTEKYTAKYLALAGDMLLTLPHRRGTVANAPHTTQTQIHEVEWIMLLDHLFRGRPLAAIQAIRHHAVDGGIEVTAQVVTENTLRDVRVWATSQDDLTVGSWNGFQAYPTTAQGGGLFTAVIPPGSVAFYVEVADSRDGVNGLVFSPPEPVDPDYPLLGIPPGDVRELSARRTTGGLHLDWSNPQSSDLAGILVVGNPDHTPRTPLDGTPLYDGTGTSTELSLAGGVTFITVFTYDATGHYSPGVPLAGSLPRRPAGRASRPATDS